MGKKIEGKKIAEEIASRLKEAFSGREVKLGVLVMQPDFATEKFIAIKQKTAKAVGVELVLKQIHPTASTEKVIEVVENFSIECDGLIVQLPLAPHVEVERVIAAIPANKDVDGIKPGSEVFSPVVEAMKEILFREEISVQGKRAAIVGEGKLVGKPARRWLTEAGASSVTTITEDSTNLEISLSKADIVVLGAGHPGFIKPSMLKEGSIVLDAGTSEAGGKLAGDADPACAEKAALFTPVPGGIGPIAVVMIFQNLLTLVRGKEA